MRPSGNFKMPKLLHTEKVKLLPRQLCFPVRKDVLCPDLDRTLQKSWQKEKRGSEDEMAGQHPRCNGHELGETSGDGEGQGGLACFSSCGCRVGHDLATEQQYQK